MLNAQRALAAIVVLVVATNAHGAIITETFNFSVAGFEDASGTAPTPPPDQLVSGSFTVTFDPTIAYPTDTTNGFQLNSLTPSQLADSGVGFEYDPSDGGEILVGGLLHTDRISSEETNDFSLGVSGVQTAAPELETVSYTEVGYPGGAESIGPGLLTVSTVPEPASPAGFVLVGSALSARRVRRSAHPA